MVPTLLFAVLDEEVVMGLAERVRELVGPLVTAAGLELWDVEPAPGAIRVLVDAPGGVDLDTLGEVSLAVSAALDAHDVGPPGRYQLEVSSPGVERVLRTPTQYLRFLGTLLSVKTTVPVDGARRFRGVLLAADDDGITLGPDADAGSPDGAGGAGERRLAYSTIDRAHTVLVWGPAPKPGSPGRRGRGAPSRARAASASASAPTKDAS
jgi:ribosome maturation factor RimP